MVEPVKAVLVPQNRMQNRLLAATAMALVGAMPKIGVVEGERRAKEPSQAQAGAVVGRVENECARGQAGTTIVSAGQQPSVMQQPWLLRLQLQHVLPGSSADRRRLLQLQ